MEMRRGMFYRGDPLLIDCLSEEEMDEHPEVKKRKWQFEAASLDAAEERALRNQTNYNKSALQDRMRYVYVEDSRGNRRDIFDRA